MHKLIEHLPAGVFQPQQLHRLDIGDEAALCYSILAKGISTDGRFHTDPLPNDDREVPLDEKFAEVMLSSPEGIEELLKQHGGNFVSEEVIKGFIKDLDGDYDLDNLASNIVNFVIGYADPLFTKDARRFNIQADRMATKLESVREKVLEPAAVKTAVRLSAQDIGRAAGKSGEAIRKLFDQDNSDLTPPCIDPSTKRKYFEVKHLDEAMRHYGLNPFTDVRGLDPFTLVVANQKGGVGKSTTVNLIAHWMGLRSLRVLIVDLDAQSSTTALAGRLGLFEADREYALSDCFLSENLDIRPHIKKIHNWDNIDLIECNIAAQEVEWRLRREENENSEYASYARFKHALDGVKHDYDVIVIDTPPSLNLFNLSAVYAADGLITPVQPLPFDIDSTGFYVGYLTSFFELFATDRKLRLQKIVQTNYATNRKAEDLWSSQLNIIFRDTMFKNGIPASSAISSAATLMRSLYEDEYNNNNRSTRKRALTACDAFCQELFDEMIKVWPERSNNG